MFKSLFGKHSDKSATPSIGIALGTGGAKGVAHVLLLEVLDELGLRPSHIAGSSMGAVIGVLYCSGQPASEIRRMISDMSYEEDELLSDILTGNGPMRWLDFVEPQFHGKSLLRSKKFVSFLFQSVKRKTFDELEIPLSVVATDFWERKPVVFESGELEPAIQASMALPGLFEPVDYQGKVLIDGGVVNPVPFDLLPDSCDITIGVDAVGHRTVSEDRLPSVSDAVFNSFQIMQQSIVAEKIRQDPPDIFIELDIKNIRVLEFYRANEIFRQAEAAKQEFRQKLTRLLENRNIAPAR
jgi:NTE family protein